MYSQVCRKFLAASQVERGAGIAIEIASIQLGRLFFVLRNREFKVFALRFRAFPAIRRSFQLIKVELQKQHVFFEPFVKHVW